MMSMISMQISYENEKIELLFIFGGGHPVSTVSTIGKI
jgi:hypothetical protein